MEIYTLDRQFVKQDTIDTFESVIWTDRYSGDGDFVLSVPATEDPIAKLPKGQFMGCVGSDQPMILETRDIKNGILKTTGITLTKWLNNRIIRTSADHSVKEWHLTPGITARAAINEIVQRFCISGPELDGTTANGMPSAHLALFKIPGLIKTMEGADTSPAIPDLSVPFGPIYDVLNSLATTYDIGIKIIVDFTDGTDYQINFVNYIGADRTSTQIINPVIRFSSSIDSLTEIQDLESIADHRNVVYTFATNMTPGSTFSAGFAGPVVFPSGFDLRIEEAFIDDIPVSTVDNPTLTNLLNQKAKVELQNRKVAQLVDGQIVEIEDVKYGSNFFLGDIVEVEGNSGIRQKSRITEYIRSQDSSGEKEYPTLAMID